MIRRYLPSLSIALPITLILFWFMQYLIANESTALAHAREVRPVVLFRPHLEPKPQTEEKAPQHRANEASKTPPSLPRLSIPAMPTNNLTTDFQLHTFELSTEIDAITAIDTELMMVGLSGTVDDLGGIDDSRGVEIKPVTARKPSIPQWAYDQRITGWVLVAFDISATGRVKKVRVLDADPRGVFEEQALLAVRGWRYPLSKLAVRQITQRLEFDWRDYQFNIER